VGQCTTVCLAVQRAETVVTVRLQRVHAEFLGQGEGLLIVGLGLLDIRRLAPCCDVAEQTQGIRLIATFLALTGECQRTLGEGVRLLQAAGEHVHLPQVDATARLIAHSFRCDCLLQRLCEQRYGIGDAPGQSIRRAQGLNHYGKQSRNVPDLAKFKGTFEQQDAPVDIPFGEVELADPGIRPNAAEGVIRRLRDPDPFVSSGGAFGERSQLSQGPAQVSTGEHGGQAGHAKALSDQIACEGRHSPPEAVYRPTVVSPIMVDGADIVIRYDLKADIPEGCGESERTLPGLDGMVKVAPTPEVFGHIDGDLPQPPSIVQDLSEGLRLTQADEDPPVLSERHERIAQVEVQIDGLLARVTRFWKMLQGPQRLLKTRDRLTVARTLHGALTCPLPVRKGLCTQACLGIVVGQQFWLGLADVWKPRL